MAVLDYPPESVQVRQDVVTMMQDVVTKSPPDALLALPPWLAAMLAALAPNTLGSAYASVLATTALARRTL